MRNISFQAHPSSKAFSLVLREPTNKSECYLVSRRPEHQMLNDVVGEVCHQSSQKIQRNTPILELYPTLWWPSSSTFFKNEHIYSGIASLNYWFPGWSDFVAIFFSVNEILSWINLIIVCAPIQFQGFPTMTAYSVSLLRCFQEWISIFPEMIVRLFFF